MIAAIRRMTWLAFGGFAMIAAPAIAQGPISVAGTSQTLRTRSYVWGMDPGTGELQLVISLPTQHLYVYRAGQLIGASRVSTGRPGHRTPSGTFEVLERQRFHRSNLYSNAPMPFMERLTWSGVAIHAGHLPGFPASHGCIRLPRAFAERLYSMTRLGVPVLITDQAEPDHVAATATATAGDSASPTIGANQSVYRTGRYAIVTMDRTAYVGPGETLFAKPRPVVQPVPHTR